jgi:hypothetical protein
MSCCFALHHAVSRFPVHQLSTKSQRWLFTSTFVFTQLLWCWDKVTLSQLYFMPSRMNRIAAFFLLALTVLLAGCTTPDVKYSDLQPATTATVVGDTVTVHLGSDLKASACWTRPKARVEGRTVYVVGYRTMREQSRDFAVRLPASSGSQPVSVVWVDSDGSRVAVPITK